MLQHVCACLFYVNMAASLPAQCVNRSSSETQWSYLGLTLRLPGTEKTRHTIYTSLMFQGTIHFATYDTERTQTHPRINLIALRIWLSAWMSKSHRVLFSLHWFGVKKKKRRNIQICLYVRLISSRHWKPVLSREECREQMIH